MKKNNPKSLKHLSKSALHKEVDNEKDNISLLRCAVKEKFPIRFVNHLSDMNLIHTKDEYGCTMLHYIADIGDLEIIKFLLQNNADINAKNNGGYTPILFAIDNKNVNLEAVAFLLKNRANINAKNNKGWSPLHIASQNGNVELTKLLVNDNNINVNSKNIYGWTPLHLATYLGHVEVVKILLKDTYKRILVNEQENEYCTALHLASAQGNIELVSTFLEVEGINLNIKDKYGWTPLHIATQLNHIKVVKVLLNDKYKRIFINEKKQGGFTPLHIAASSNKVDIVKALLAFDADVNEKNESGKTALDLAKEKNHTECIALLEKIMQNKT